MDTKLLTAREVESLFRYSPGHATRLARKGKLPHLVLPDGAIRFDEVEIQRLLQRSDDAGDKEQEGRS
jgi:predicted site-specific integrase-resolvase